MTTKETKEALSSVEVLDYMAKFGKELAEYANKAKAMFEIAGEREIDVDLSKKLEKFQPGGEIEVNLINIKSKFMEISSELFEQGVKITRRELKEKMKEMGM